MKILHVIVSLHPCHGGPPAIAYRLAAAQAGLGHEVVLASSPDPQPDEAERVAAAVNRVPKPAGIRLESVPPVGQKQLFLGGGAAAGRLRDLVGWADFVHLHNVWDPIILLASRACRAADKPYLVLLNGMLDPWSLSQKRLKKQIAMAMGYRAMLNHAAAMHLGNDDEQRLIAPLGLKSPGVIIPNGVFMEEIEPLPPPGQFRPKLGLGDRPFVLFLSRIHYKKGLDYLADAWAIVAQRHPEAQLVVVGVDDGELANFKQRVSAAGLDDRVHLPGPQYGADKFAALVDATVFCLPSRQEGFSVAITEALACGLPAVVSDACHFPEVETERAGRVVPLDAARVAEALLEVLNDPAKREAMAQAGRQLIRSKYTWPRIAELTVTHYTDILKRR